MALILNKLELVFGTVASFNILMQNFYELQEGKTEKVTVYVTTGCNTAEIPHSVQHERGTKTLKGLPFSWALKLLHNSM